MLDGKHVIGVLGILAAIGTVGAQAQSRQIGSVGITVYQDSNYRGRNATFRNDDPDLGRSGFANMISSLQVAPGELWEACAGVNYQPPCQVFSGTESDLQRRSWNDRISSLRRVRNSGGSGGFYPGAGGGRRRMVLYSEENFRGSTYTITGPTSSIGSYNDKARSVRIDGGTWDLCEDIDFGKCRTVDRDLSNLSGLGLSKRVSSARPAGGGGGGGSYPPPQQNTRLVLYDRNGYRGGSQTLDYASEGLGGFGTRAVSAQVIGTWQLCDGPNFSGRCVVISQNVPDLASYGMNNRVSSARPMSGRAR
jgi:hypothetical protein